MTWTSADDAAEVLTRFREEGAVTDAVVQQARSACAMHPSRADLLCLLADLVRLCPTSPDPAGEAIASLTTAIRIDSRCGRAWQELAFCHDVYRGDADQAEKCFVEAIRLNAGPDSYYGLARVLAEQGKSADALAIVKDGLAMCPGNTRLLQVHSEINRGDWDPIE